MRRPSPVAEVHVVNTPALPARLAFIRAIAADLLRYRGPRRAEARQLVRLCRLWHSLVTQADGADGRLAEGLAAATLRAIEAAAARFQAVTLA